MQQWRKWQAQRALAREYNNQSHHDAQEHEPVFYPDGVDYSLPPIWAFEDGAQPTKEQLANFYESVYGTQYWPGNSYQTQFGDPFRGPQDNPYIIPTDNPLREWNEQMRYRIAVNVHTAWQRNPLAKRAVNVTRQFAVGRGHSVKYLNKEVQAILEEFRRNPENNVKGYDKTFIQDLQLDGELFIRFASAADGRTVIWPLKPWRVIGINTDPEFFRRVNFYRYQLIDDTVTTLDPQGGKPGEGAGQIEIPADEIIHVAINNHSYELRGRSDLFAALTWLKGHKNWLEERARQNKWRGAVVWWVKVLANAPGIIARKVAQYRRPPKSGSVWVTSQNEEISALNNPVAAGDAAEDGRQLRLMVANAVDLPEYMLGDGENANLATASAQELPALWKFTDVQEIGIEQIWTPIYRRVIENAINAGMLAEELQMQDDLGDGIEDINGNQRTVKAIEAFEVQYYNLQASDPKDLAEALGISVSNEFISEEGARTVIAPSFGLDPTLEARRTEKEREERQERANQGFGLPQNAQMPGVPQDDDMEDDTEEEMNDNGTAE